MSGGWRAVLVIAALLEFWGGLRDFPILFGNLSEIPGPGIGGAVIVAKIALQPILGFVALVCALTGRIKVALLGMALIILLTWLNYMPSVLRHGLELRGSPFVILQMIFQILLAPFLAGTVAVLAMRGERLSLATLLAVLPTFVFALGVVAFGIAVAIYGF